MTAGSAGCVVSFGALSKQYRGLRLSRMIPQPKRRPGDRILDRHCPDLSPEEREEAHERLRSLAKVLITIEKKEALGKARLETESDGFALEGGYTCESSRD